LENLGFLGEIFQPKPKPKMADLTQPRSKFLPGPITKQNTKGFSKDPFEIWVIL